MKGMRAPLIKITFATLLIASCFLLNGTEASEGRRRSGAVGAVGYQWSPVRTNCKTDEVCNLVCRGPYQCKKGGPRCMDGVCFCFYMASPSNFAFPCKLYPPAATN